MSSDIEGEGLEAGGELEASAGSSPVTDGDGEVVSTSPAPEGLADAVSQTQVEWQGVLDYAKSQGIQLPYKDDAVAVRALLDSYRLAQERNYYSDLGRQMAPYADQIQAWIQQNQIAASQRSQPQVDPYAAPEWDDRWALMVERDPNTGMIRSKPGYDPRIGEKAQVYADWRNKWDNDPKFRESYVESKAESRARQLIEERFASHAEGMQAQNIVSQNAPWIFQTYQDGSPVLGQDGMKMLSPAGHLYAQKVNEIWNAGIRNVDQCNSLARTFVENAVMRQQFLSSPGPQGGYAAQTLGQSVPNVAGRPSASPRAPRVKQEGLSLRDMLNARMTGMPDEDANV